MVTNLLQAPLLVLLSVVDGLFTADPTRDPTAQAIPTVPVIDGEVLENAGVRSPFKFASASRPS